MSDEEPTSPSNGAAPPPGPAPPGAPGGPPLNIQQLVAAKRLQQAQAQVGEVVDIMRVNVEKVLERDQKISELDRRADDLQEGASQFQQHAVKLKRKYWWENVKVWLIIAVIVLMIVIIVVVTTTQNNGQIALTGDKSITVTDSPGAGAKIAGGGEKVPEELPSNGGEGIKNGG